MLANIIIEALGKYKSIQIDGLGCFFIRQVTSYDEHSEKLNVHPPLKAILFKEHCKSSLNIDQLAMLESWPDSHVIEIEELVQNQMNLLLSDGFSIIEGLGTLKRESDQSIQLYIDHNPFVQDMTVLPELDISMDSTTPKIEANLTAVKEMTPKSWKKADSQASNSNEFKSMATALVLIVIISLVSVLIIKWMFFQNPESTEGTKSELNVHAQNAELPAMRDMFENDQMNKYRDILSEENLLKGCEIVVGSFKKIQNAEKLAQEARLLNYKVSVIQSDNLHRVVVNFDCVKNDLIDYLLKVREELNPKAWYLSPEHYDPFK